MRLNILYITSVMIMMSCNYDTKRPERASVLKTRISDTFKEIDRTGNWQPLIEIMSDSVEFSATIPEGTPISGVFKGKENVRNYFSNILPSVASFKQNKPTEYFSNEDKVVIIGDDSYTLQINHKTFRSPYAIVIEFEKDDIIIKRITIIQDLSGLFESYKANSQ